MDNRSTKISRSDLPQELLAKIAKAIPTDTDLRRFRAVCNSWRSSIPAPLKKPLKIPFPIDPELCRQLKYDGGYFDLTEWTVYLLQPLELEKEKEKETPNCWILKTESSEDGKIHVLNPVSDERIKVLPENILPKVLNTLNFRVFEICKSYNLRYMNDSNPNHDYHDLNFAKKVVVSRCGDSDEYALMVIDTVDKLWYIKSGQEKWTRATTGYYINSVFLDVVNFKGQFYGADFAGRVWVFDSSFKAERVIGPVYIIGPVYTDASKRHLVELYNGELCLVEQITDRDKKRCKCDDIDVGCTCGFSRSRFKNSAEVIVIYRMDKEAQEWVEVKTFDDRIIFVGDDCSFSLSEKEFHGGWKGTRVFYSDQHIFFRTEEEKPRQVWNNFDDDDSYCDNYDDNYCDAYDGDNNSSCDQYDMRDSDDEAIVDDFVPKDDVKLKFRGLHGHNIGVCDLGNGKIGSLMKFPEYADIFWPPPSWLSRN